MRVYLIDVGRASIPDQVADLWLADRRACAWEGPGLALMAARGRRLGIAACARSALVPGDRDLGPEPLIDRAAIARRHHRRAVHSEPPGGS